MQRNQSICIRREKKTLKILREKKYYRDFLQGLRLNWLMRGENLQNTSTTSEAENYLNKTIKNIVLEEKALYSPEEIIKEIKSFHERLFKNSDTESYIRFQNFNPG